MLENADQTGHLLSQPPPGLLLALGSAYFRSGRLADAEREYRATLGVQPKCGEARVNLAVVLLVTGRADEANAQLKLAKKTGYAVPRGLETDVETRLAARR
jgi:Flp pilus assembly protein TadD